VKYNNCLIDFPISEKNGHVNLINLEFTGSSSYANDLNEYVSNWYGLPNDYIVMGAVWSYWDKNDEGVNISTPKTIFVIVKDEAFEGLKQPKN
jgi:hypothetical protein